MIDFVLTPESGVLLCLIGFSAGFLDSIVGGGGLIATPAMLNLFPGWQILNIIGTNRASSILGTSVAAWNYSRKIRMEWHIILSACVAALLSSFWGVQLAQSIDTHFLKKIILVLIVVLAVYTAFKKELGQTENRRFSYKIEALAALVVGGTCGFYNGMIGPGTGTLLVFGFVSVLGLDFLKSSAVAKMANVAGDVSSWCVLAVGGWIVWKAALPLVLSNMLGSWLGSRLAILRGLAFIRWMFLAVTFSLIIRLVLFD